MTEQPDAAPVPDWTLGWRLQRALAHAGIGVTEMAAELDVSRGTLSRWMSDRGAPPRAIYLREWAALCGVDYQWLAGECPRPLRRLAAMHRDPMRNNRQSRPRLELAA